MKSILNEISVLRGAKPLTLDTTNKNRYRVEAIENDGSQTSYFFTTPIYNEETRKGVDMNFHAYNDSFVCLGSNAKITANKSLRMENQAGCCEIVLPDRPTMNAEGSLFCEGLTLSPTTNGIAIKSDFKKQKELILILEVDNPSLGIRANGRYFALMREKFRPFLIASCIGTTDEGGAIIAPAALNYQKISETRFLLSVLPTTLDGVSVQLEINLYEPKLFQDTTVESNSPNTNNVFGTIGFLGTPTLLSLMARIAHGRKPDTLRHIVISGECMGREIGMQIAQAFPGVSIYHVYGLTEASPRVAYLPPEDFEEFPDFVGKPLRSVSIQLRRKNGSLCKTDEEGTLWVKGQNVMLGYYQNAEATKKALKKGWLCTGDIATVNRKGFLKIKGRSDDLIIKAGMNIYPAEIEAALKSDPRVKEVLAYGYSNASGTQIALKIAGNFGTVAEIKDLCRKVLPPYEIPTHIELLDELPKNGSGKIIRKT